MAPFLDEIKATFDCGIYSTALVAALIVPDACGAAEFGGGSNRSRFTQWYDNYVECPSLPNNLNLDGAFAWKVRNGLMHETALNFNSYGVERIMFTVPDRRRNIIDRAIMSDMGHNKESAISLDLASFISRILVGADTWLSTATLDDQKRERLDGLIQLRPQGRVPFIVGFPLIT